MLVLVSGDQSSHTASQHTNDHAIVINAFKSWNIFCPGEDCWQSSTLATWVSSTPSIPKLNNSRLKLKQNHLRKQKFLQALNNQNQIMAKLQVKNYKTTVLKWKWVWRDQHIVTSWCKSSGCSTHFYNSLSYKLCSLFMNKL